MNTKKKKKAETFLDTPEKRKLFEQAFKSAKEFTEELDKKRKVTQEDLEQEICTQNKSRKFCAFCFFI